MQKTNASVYAALIANLFIAAVKFTAGFLSNSSAMLSEGVHSVVDTVNELLLLWGIRQSKKPRDREKPFGYGRELFFWSFIVSMLIFGLGGGISIYQGVTHIIHPQETGDPFWNYIVLGASALFEGTSFIIAARAFNKIRGNRGWWQTIHDSTNPSDFMVLFEDGAAVIGLCIVAVCVWLNHHFGMPFLEGVASLLVGLLLICVSLLLARESHSLLIGEGVASATRKRIIALVEADPSAVDLLKLHSIYVGPDDVLMMMELKMSAELQTADIHVAIERIRCDIRELCPQIKYVLIQPG